MAQDYPSHVKRWDVFEVVLNGTSEGNPYTEQTLTGIFTSRDESVTVRHYGSREQTRMSAEDFYKQIREDIASKK